MGSALGCQGFIQGRINFLVETGNLGPAGYSGDIFDLLILRNPVDKGGGDYDWQAISGPSTLNFLAGVGSGTIFEGASNLFGPGVASPQSQKNCAVGAQSLNTFLASKGSPLAGQGQALFNAGEQYNVDPRFIVALAGAETSFGKTTPWGAYNAWDWGYNGTNSPFSSWSAGIDTVTAGIAGRYYMGAEPPINGAATIYMKYCGGVAGCAQGLLNTIYILQNEEGGNGANLNFPCDRSGS